MSVAKTNTWELGVFLPGPGHAGVSDGQQAKQTGETRRHHLLCLEKTNAVAPEPRNGRGTGDGKRSIRCSCVVILLIGLTSRGSPGLGCMSSGTCGCDGWDGTAGGMAGWQATVSQRTVLDKRQKGQITCAMHPYPCRVPSLGSRVWNKLAC